MTVVDYEPSLAFNERCTEILNRWERGELPFKQSIQMLSDMGHEARAAQHRANEGRVELLLGVMQGYRANLDASIRHFERARDLFAQVNNCDQMIGAIHNLGEVYRQKNDFSRAHQLFHTAYDAAGSLNNPRLQAISACNDGLILLSLECYDQARAMLEKAAQHTHDMMDDEGIARQMLCEIYHGLTIAALKTEQLSDAWRYAQESLRAARQIGQPLALGLANRALGEVLSALLMASKSSTVCEDEVSNVPDDYFQTACEAFQEIKAEGELARTLYAHALSLMTRGHRMKAERQLQQAINIFNRLGLSDDAAKAARAQMGLLANAGN